MNTSFIDFNTSFTSSIQFKSFSDRCKIVQYSNNDNKEFIWQHQHKIHLTFQINPKRKCILCFKTY